jgi:hypothetical protein
MTLARLRRGDAIRRVPATALVVSTLAAAAVLGLSAVFQPIVTGGLLGLVVVAAIIDATWRWPGPAVVVLVALLPFYPLLFGDIQKLGVPVVALAYLRFWKDLVLVVLAARALSAARSEGYDRLDQVTLLFLGLVALFVLLPIGPPLYVRLLAGRELGSFLVLFLAVRHAGLSLPRIGRHLEVALLLSGAVVGAVALWNYLSPDAYAAWINGAAQWQNEALGNQVGPGGVLVDHTVVAGHVVVRAGSIFLSPLGAAFYLLVPIAILVARVSLGQARRWELVIGGVCCAGLLVTVTRSAIVAVPLMIVLGILATRQTSRTATALLLAAAALYPLADSIGIGSQFTSALDTNAVSTAGHLTALQVDFNEMLRVPIGHGLGTGGSQGSRFEVAGAITAESWYFQVGIELGVLGLVFFLVLMWRALGELVRRARAGNTTTLAALCALAGVALGGLFLHSFGTLYTAYAVWALVGIALSAPGGPPLTSPAR